MFNRRDFLNAAAIASSLSISSGKAAPMGAANKTIDVIDTNISLFEWPFRELPLATTKALVTKLNSLGISSAWASSFAGLLHRDVYLVNERLVSECRSFPQLRPVGVINPELPNWEADFDRCVHHHKMHAVRIFPNYHQFELSDSRFASLMAKAEKSRVIVQICVAMEDGRTQHPLVQIADVVLTPLETLAARFSKAKIQILNHRSPARLSKELLNASNIVFDTARADDTDGIQKLTEAVGLDRVLFGSHSPFLIPEAALIRAAESKLEDRELAQVLFQNAQSLSGLRTS